MWAVISDLLPLLGAWLGVQAVALAVWTIRVWILVHRDE